MLDRTARTTVAALVAAVVAVATVLVLPGQGSAAQTLTITPSRPGDTSVRGGSPLQVEGTVPAEPRGALLEALGANGQVLGAVEYSSGVFGPEVQHGDYLSASGGNVKGRVTLTSLFSGPRQGVAVTGARLVLCSSDARDEETGRLLCRDGADPSRTTSTVARVDYAQPFLRRYETVALPLDGQDGRAAPVADTVRVVFSEPVRHPEGDSSLDWRVEGRTVREVLRGPAGDCAYQPGDDTSAGQDGCTRLLRLDRALGEDEEPQVSYVGSRVPGRFRYVDLASNDVDIFTGAPDSAAVDRIRPAAPSITAVSGRSTSAGSVAAPSDAPTVRLGNLVAGQTAQVSATATDGRSVSTDEVPTTDGTLEVVLPTLPAQPQGAPYALSAVVRDRRLNSSTGTTLPARSDGTPNPVSYAVDLAVPQLVRALPSTSRDVEVVFSEPVAGSDDPSAWTITTPTGSRLLVTAVGGTGDRRVLSTVQPVPDGSTVVYAPRSGRYADSAGNPVADATAVVNGVDLPVLTDPTSPVVTRAGSQVVRGSAEAGHEVELYAGSGGRASGPVLDRVVLNGEQTAFALTAALAPDADTDLVVLVRDPVSRASRTVQVPRITQDGTPPAVAPTSPGEGVALAGGSTQEITWDHVDANPGSVRVELTLDGSRFIELSGGAAPDQPFRFAVPRVDTESAQVRLTPRDAAGNTGTARLSPVFAIDATPPTLAARTVDARTLRVVLSERVWGSSSAGDWRVDGEPVGGAVQSTSPEGRTSVLLSLRAGRALAPDATPVVRYEPALTADRYRDRANQGVVDRERIAEDGIAPAAPTVTAPSASSLTQARSVLVQGTAEPRTRLDLLDTDGRFAAAQVRVQDDGSWSTQAQLQPDATNVLRVLARDDGGNTSPATAVPAIDQDATAPAVRVSAPAPGSRIEPGTRATASWTSTDRHPVDGQTLVELSTDGGRTWRFLAQEQPRSGSAAFDVPEVRTGTAALRVTVPDQVGRRGTAVSSPIGIGMAAATPTPTPTPSTTPSTTPGALPDGTFTPAVGRLLDTRPSAGGPGQLGPGGTLRLQVAGEAGVPRTGAEAVALTLTAVQPGEKTHVSVVPTGADTEATASLTAAKGETVANHVTVRLGADGAVLLRNNSGRTHLVVDLLGWYAGDSAPAGVPYAPLPPQRLLDTREGLGAAPGQTAGTVSLRVTGRGGVPAEGVTAVVLGVAAVGPSASTHVTVWPGGRGRPETSNLNVPRGQTRANLVTVPVGPDGTVQLASGGARVHLVADVFGWYGPSAAGVLEPVEPARVLDTRTGSRRPATAGRDLVLQVAGRGGLPADGVRAVVLQLTAVAPSDSTHVTAWGGGALPETANLNATRGTTVSTQVVVPVAADGTVRLAVGKGRVHLVADVAGWFRAR